MRAFYWSLQVGPHEVRSFPRAGANAAAVLGPSIGGVALVVWSLLRRL